MMRRIFIGLIAVAMISIAALAIQFPHQFVAPGDMLPGHKAIEHDCFACHVPLLGAEPEKCVACHKVADIGLRTTTGLARPPSPKPPFHQQLVEQDCIGCHREHEVPIGVRLRSVSFSHDLVAPSTRDTCESCHVPPRDEMHRTIVSGCSQCHATSQWKPASFDHTKYFELDRDHNVACTTCHVASNFKVATCFGCHEHKPDKIKREHAEEGIDNIENCASCHRNAHDEPKHRDRERKAR